MALATFPLLQPKEERSEVSTPDRVARCVVWHAVHLTPWFSCSVPRDKTVAVGVTSELIA